MAHISSETRQSVKIDVRGFNPLSRDVPKFKGSCFGLFSLFEIRPLHLQNVPNHPQEWGKNWLTGGKSHVFCSILQTTVQLFWSFDICYLEIGQQWVVTNLSKLAATASAGSVALHWYSSVVRLLISAVLTVKNKGLWDNYNELQSNNN